MIEMAYMDRMYEEIQNKVENKVLEVMRSGQYILGDYVEKFEKSMGQKYDFPYSAGVASGTDALEIALRAVGVASGDKVVIPAFTIFVDAAVIKMLGAKPVYADVRANDFNLDPESLKKVMSSDVKAILLVHLFGQCADMEAIEEIAREYSVPVIEDACQSIGAKYDNTYSGLLGDVGCFSFYPTKNLGGMGDGGFISSQNSELSEQIDLLRLHGIGDRSYVQEIWAYNSRLDAIQAAILNVKLDKLDEWENRRRSIANYYLENIEHPQIELPEELTKRYHVWHQFTLRVDERDSFTRHLQKNDISHGIFYPKIIPDQPAYQDTLSYQPAETWSVSKKLSEEVVSIPITPQLKDSEVQYIVNKINEFNQ